MDNSGNMYVTDSLRHVIFKILTNGEVILWAGKLGEESNNSNLRVKGYDARFSRPMGLEIDASGKLYVADTGNNQIRMITQDQYVTLVAGSPDGYSGFNSGIGSSALFDEPNDVAIDLSGVIYVADMNNHSIRRIVPGTSQVSTVAGSGYEGDGYGFTAEFRYPYSVATDNNGVIYIADSGNYKIKKIDKNLYVHHFSGSGIQGSQIGSFSTSQYNDLKFSDVSPSGDLFMVDFKERGDSRLLRIDTNGNSYVVRDYAGSKEGIYVIGVTVDNSGKIYTTESAETIFAYSSSSSSSYEYSSSSSSSSSSDKYSSSSSSSSLQLSSSSSSSSIDSSSSSSSSSSSENDCNKVTEEGNNRVTEDGINLVHDGCDELISDSSSSSSSVSSTSLSSLSSSSFSSFSSSSFSSLSSSSNSSSSLSSSSSIDSSSSSSSSSIDSSSSSSYIDRWYVLDNGDIVTDDGYIVTNGAIFLYSSSSSSSSS